MNMSKPFVRVFKLSLILTLLASSSVFASNLLITRHFSGVWDQPEQESQGLILQIGEQDGDKKVGIAYWFTYGEDLQTTWYLAVGPIDGNEINMKLYTAFDIAFMADDVEGNMNVVQVGTLNLAFKNCNHGIASYETPEDVIGAGEFPIKRINSIYRTRCSGGISDDTPSDRKPMQLEVSLYPPVEGGSGEGKAKFWERTDRSDFKVTVEDIPEGDGPYTLKVCSEAKGEMTITAGEGELAFRSPESDGIPLLDFDPRPCVIELFDGENLVLTSGDELLGEKTHGPHGPKDHTPALELEADFESTGVIAGAKGSAEFEVWADETEFSVKIKDVPAGFYAVVVGGIEVGEIEVIEDDGDLEGKLKFTDPQKAETLLLDFDPLGQEVQVLQADDQVILQVSFPDS